MQIFIPYEIRNSSMPYMTHFRVIPAWSYTTTQYKSLFVRAHVTLVVYSLSTCSLESGSKWPGSTYLCLRKSASRPLVTLVRPEQQATWHSHSSHTSQTSHGTVSWILPSRATCLFVSSPRLFLTDNLHCDCKLRGISERIHD